AEVPRSDSSKQGVEEDELDGLPVFGADEEESELESSSTQKDKQTDEKDENENSEGVQRSQPEDGPSQNEGSTSSQEKGEGSREEILHFPLKKIKDEPIDEDYDKALISSSHSDISRVKEELENGDHESSVPLDELRISSVFSVRGTSDAITGEHSFKLISNPNFNSKHIFKRNFKRSFNRSSHTSFNRSSHTSFSRSSRTNYNHSCRTSSHPSSSHSSHPSSSLSSHPSSNHRPHRKLQTQPPPHPQAQPTHQLQTQNPPQQQPPPGPVRICCSGCSKVLQKAPNIAPKKTCHLCLKVIGNPKDLITVPVDAANTLKEFCSLSCLSIYKSRVEGLTEEDAVVRCAVCRNPSEIQHEVNHQGILHRLCSDECFSRFRSSKRLSMSCCESCGHCTVTGNYHLVQIEDAVKKFCSPACISAYKQKSGKRVYCPCCQDFKAMDQMLEGTNAQGVIEFFCSSRCVANSQASCTLSGASFPCTNCQKLAVPQYHLVMPDGAIRNFCSYECVGRFQERLQRSAQMNGGSYHSPNTGPHPPVPHHPSAQGFNPPHNAVPLLNHNTISPYVPALRPTNPQDPQQQPEALGPVKLPCKQCQKQFSSKPEVLQFKNHVGLFCSRLCCDMYKRERDVKAVCEYCKEEKVAKEIVIYEKQPRAFCCEGCKLLYKHDYAKQHGGQCRVCAFCCNVTHKTIQNHFGGKLEEFCSEECMSLYTVLFYEMAKCHACKNQGPLKESIRWDETVQHFCNLHCLLHFCSKSIIPDQPNSNGINTAATTAQAPLSLSKDMPVIGGVVSLASALAGNTALTGALPTSNASSKIIGDASTQTDAAVNGDPQQRRMLKNKAVMCKPINDEQSIQCNLEPPKLLSETVIDENGEKVRLIPVPIPIPTPIYIPLPVHLYTQYTPLPLGFTLPIPVPLIVPNSPEAAQPSSTKGSVPSQSSVEDEDVEKGKSRPLSHGDQGSTYSGDLESEARSTPFSWADPEDSSHNLKPSVPLSEPEGSKDAPASSTSSNLLDLEKDIPLASNDHEAAKEQKSPAKRRKRGKKEIKAEILICRATFIFQSQTEMSTISDVEPKSFKEELDVADCAQSILDTNIEQFNVDSGQHGGTLGKSIFISSECAPLDDELDEEQDTFKYDEELTPSNGFSLALEAVKKVGGFDPDLNRFKKSVALKMGYSLKCATEVALEENDMADEARNHAKKFIELLGTDWLSYEPPSPCKKTEGDIIQLIDDVVKLQNFLKNTEDKAIVELMAHPNCKSWQRLRESLLAQVALFNRGRRNIVEKMLLEEYIQRDKEPIHGKMYEPLSKLEQALSGALIRVGVSCKDGSWVPVMFTERMASSLDILIKYREDVGVPMDNPYMFPQMTADSHIRAHDCIRIFAQNCGVTKLEVTTRKYVATIFQIRNLNCSEKQQGRRRSVTDVASGMVSTPPSTKLHHMYGVKAWAGWVQWRTQHTDASPLTVKEDVLDCSSEELSATLCHFISEVRRPNGQTYAPDSVYYLCLGIQQHLLENGRLENIFTDPLYNKFTTDITKMIKDWECNLTPSGFLQSRIEESFLWECKQLGALSPFVLLNTLIFFGVKHLNLKTAEQHQRLSFSTITRCSRSTKHGKSSYLRFRFAGKYEAEKEKRVLLGKRKREDAEENVEYGEMPENTDDPLHCPVRLYEFYLSKCPDSVKESPDVFYLQPESSCHPGSSVWYSAQSLDGTILDSMLSRILAIRGVHLEPKQQQQLSSSDEDTS
ncbi:hypothetical protein QTP70_017092, partial [Hemibagrus guttatus]